MLQLQYSKMIEFGNIYFFTCLVLAVAVAVLVAELLAAVNESGSHRSLVKCFADRQIPALTVVPRSG